MDCNTEENEYTHKYIGKHYQETIDEQEFKELQDIRMWLYEIASGKTNLNSDDRDMANRVLDFLKG